MLRKLSWLLLCISILSFAAALPASPQSRAVRDAGIGPLLNEPPPIPAEQIIQSFAAKEAEFRQARGNYTYTQRILVQEFDADNRPGGRFERHSEVIFTPEGRRYERVTYEPPSTLRLVSMSPEDMKDFETIQPFILTTEELPRYQPEYLGRQQIDEIGTYVFRVRPRRIESGQRYFEGTVWVDDRDLQIVRTEGKAVPDLRSRSGENLFPRFETWRANIDGNYWFPVLTRADDVLHFSAHDVRIRMSIRYSDYKQFKSSSRILSTKPVDPPQ
jgi:hypothetical protein